MSEGLSVMATERFMTFMITLGEDYIIGLFPRMDVADFLEHGSEVYKNDRVGYEQCFETDSMAIEFMIQESEMTSLRFTNLQNEKDAGFSLDQWTFKLLISKIARTEIGAVDLYGTPVSVFKPWVFSMSE